MPLRNQQYQFEQSVVLIEGGHFQPLTEAVERWSHVRLLGRGGDTHEILYELSDGRFVYLKYVGCFTVRTWRWCWPVSQVHGTFSSAPEILTSLDAAKLLMRWQAVVPARVRASLAVTPSMASPTVIDAPRPLEYWATCLQRDRVRDTQAHLLPGAETLEDLIDIGVSCVQEVRRWKDRDLDGTCMVRCPTGCWRALASHLFGRYPVDRSAWWGGPHQIPPESVPVEETPAFMGNTSLASTLAELRTLFDPLIYVLSTASSGVRRDSPTASEHAWARVQMRERRRQLEGLVLRLQRELDEFWKRGDADSQTGHKLTGQPKLPSTKAIRVYFLYAGTGKTQIQVAELYGRVFGEPMAQGQVSRYLREVIAWSRNGNHVPLPELTKPESATVVDPARLELGPAREGRPPRQRRKKTSDE